MAALVRKIAAIPVRSVKPAPLTGPFLPLYLSLADLSRCHQDRGASLALALASVRADGRIPGQSQTENVDATAPEAAKAIKELGFKNRSLVIRAQDGRVLWKQPDHQLKVRRTRSFAKALAGLNQGFPGHPASGPLRCALRARRTPR